MTRSALPACPFSPPRRVRAVWRTGFASLLSRARAISRRVGRRGASLLSFGFVDEVIGVSLLDAQSRPVNTTAYEVIERLAPLSVWALVWIVVGVVCATQAFTRDDQIGFACAIAIKVVWASGFLAAWVIYDAYRGWVAAATWGVVAALVYLIAGWPEPRRRQPQSPPGGGG